MVMVSSSVSEYIHALIDSKRLGHQVSAHQYQEGRSADRVAVEQIVSHRLKPMLATLGVQNLYGHQEKAIKLIRNGTHTVVATPTASGKSLVYNLSLFEMLIKDPEARGIYIFPLKALTQDQHKGFDRWASAASPLKATAAIYDGDTSAYKRKKIRQSPPNVIMTNPEMVHLALLPYHHQWSDFFRHLKLVVIDEVHTYRGLLGSHMSQVLQRFKRVCAYYGSEPTFVFTSATVANPDELARQLCAMPVSSVQESESARGGRHLVLMDGSDGPAQTAILLLKAAMARQLRTIVYTQSRKLAELITIWVQQSSGQWTDKISVYRAGLLAPERRQIEQRLKSGDLLAVVSTSALELGIDIGDLDICILVGYPGSMIATWQRSGRVGRKGQEAAMVLVGGNDALDQYFLSQPDAFFNGRAESAVINPFNPVVQMPHLICAAAELPIKNNEEILLHQKSAICIERLEHNGQLLRTHDGQTLHSMQQRPHRKVDLRSAGRCYTIVADEQVIGELNEFRLYRDAHPGAVYMHQGLTYLVGEVDDITRIVRVQPSKVSYHTRVRSDTDVKILETYISKSSINTCIFSGQIKVIDQVTDYQKIDTVNGRNLGYIQLSVPPVIFSTDALWFEISSEVCRQVTQKGFDLMGTLHAAEHAMIGMMPLLVLADRNDIGGVATPWHPQNSKATIFIYDGIPGGAGFSRQAYKLALMLLQTALGCIERCSCKSGCPACVHSPKCGSGNQPMDKSGASYLLELLASSAIETPMTETTKSTDRKAQPKPLEPPKEQRYGVFDLETQRSAQEVGGWHNAHRMLVSCGVVYDQLDDSYTVYLEDQVDELITHLKELDVVVGFNSKRFDYRVLSGYSNFDFSSLPSLDLLELVYKRMGFRLSLDHLANETLNAQKSGSGLDALNWWQQGRVDKIISYCRKDVEITRDLYCYARDKGYLVYRKKDAGRFRVPMRL